MKRLKKFLAYLCGELLDAFFMVLFFALFWALVACFAAGFGRLSGWF